MDINELTQSVIDSLSTKDADGNTTAFDFNGLKEVITSLQSIKKGMKEQADAAAKEEKKANTAKLAEVGKAYYDTLALGDHFTITNSRGETIELIKIETKSNSGSTAAGELVNPPVDAKTTKRYPKFNQVNVPADFTMQVTA